MMVMMSTLYNILSYTASTCIFIQTHYPESTGLLFLAEKQEISVLCLDAPLLSLQMWKVFNGLDSYTDSGLLQLAWPRWLLILSTHNPNSVVMESTNEVGQQFMDTHGHTCRNHDNRECLYLSSRSSVIDNHNNTSFE